MTKRLERLLPRAILSREWRKAVTGLIDNSRGVDGLHLNGDPALWDVLHTGGEFESWLRDFDAALEEEK